MGRVPCLVLGMVCVTTREVVGVAVVGEAAEPIGRGTMELRRRRCLSSMSFLGLSGLGTCCDAETGEEASQGGGGLDMREGGLEGFEADALLFLSPVPPPPPRGLKVMSEGKSSSEEYEKFKMSSFSSCRMPFAGGDIKVLSSPSDGEGLGMERQ